MRHIAMACGPTATEAGRHNRCWLTWGANSAELGSISVDVKLHPECLFVRSNLAGFGLRAKAVIEVGRL